jgi:hypothetical protein
VPPYRNGTQLLSAAPGDSLRFDPSLLAAFGRRECRNSWDSGRELGGEADDRVSSEAGASAGRGGVSLLL